MRSAPIAEVEVTTPFYKGQLRALAVENPIADVIIGNIDGASGEHREESETACAVKTRSAAMKQSDDSDRVEDEAVVNDEGDQTTPLMEFSTAEIREAQRNDASLAKSWEKVDMEGPENRDSWITVRNGLLYRIKEQQHGQGRIEQLLAPLKFRKKIMEMAHEGVFGGHLGAGRTLDKIMQSFFWPGINADVQRYCRSCDACQKTSSKGKQNKVPLVTTPLIEEPMSRVAVDLIGPLPRSDKGNKYILTLVDYATRFPEAKALSGITAEQVSEAFLEIFSRLGIPKEIISDQGTQFTGELMREVSGLLKTKQIFTSPYHAMANGLVERFNGVLKNMLRRTAFNNPKSWDRHIAPLLFAYRETPQASTGFSPFELVFSHKVKGPLDILKDLWTGEVDGKVKSTYEYVVNMRERLQDAVELANEHLGEAKTRQKKYYDRGAKQRTFREGDKVLILLPTEANKLKMAWKGVLDQVGPVDYGISLKGKRRVYHANMLKYYNKRKVEDVLAAAVVVEEGDHEDQPPPLSLSNSTPQLQQSEDWRDVVICETLTESQKEDVRSLVKRFADTFSDVPGRTTMAEHKIELLDQKPVKIRQGTLPYATREAFNKEVDAMLQADIIEPSDSAYSSPIVLVKKPSGEYRFCNDYRRLNAVSRDDAEPMPEIESIMSNLSGSKYFTKLDLTKGYWQVPLEEKTKPLTAFSTPKGLFQYKVLSFGLKGSPATFNRMMRKVLKNIGPGVEVFVDDVLCHARTWHEHMQICEKVLCRLEEANLKVRPSKTLTGMAEVEFLGHVVKEGILKPQDDKVRAIANCERPKTKKETRSFLGLTGYYRKFLPNYSSIAAPLSDLTKTSKGQKFFWDQAQENAFQTIKKMLSSAPVLSMPNWGKDFIVQTDASCTGLGACLLQEHEGVRHVIMYVSRKLKPVEVRYSTIERESVSQ